MVKIRLFLLSCLCLVLLSCALEHAMMPDPSPAVGEGLAGIVAHTESATRHVEQAKPHADATGKLHLAAAQDEHAEVLADVGEAKAALVATQAHIGQLRVELEASKDAYGTLEGRWYVTWGRRIERALWTIGLLWLALGIAAMVLGLGNPLSWSWRIGKEITRLVPAMNPFSWIRDWILSRRTSKEATA